MMRQALVVTVLICVFETRAAAPIPSIAPPMQPNTTTQGYLSSYGITVEEHFATTDDGYILRMFRLPRKAGPVILLQHGILASSWCWLVNTPEQSLGIVLWRLGYDVWLTNSRGNTYSRNHTSLRPFLDKKFWDFSFDDMALDVFANVERILNITGKANLTFVGWSQGTTQMFIAATGPRRSFLESHVNLFVALSPVTYMKDQTSLLLKVVTDLQLGKLVEKVFPFGFLDQDTLPAVAQWFCIASNGTLCSITVDSVCGTSPMDEPRAIENLTAHFPAGVSVKGLNHYEQLIRKDRFGRYDYGFAGNLKHYHVPWVPDYDLKRLAVKTALFMGSRDDLADPGDTARLQKSLKGNKNVVMAKQYDKYSHVTWLVGKTWAWFDDLNALLRQYNPLPFSAVLI